MHFEFNDEQAELKRGARTFLADRFPLERLGDVADSTEGWDPESWHELAELGWLGVTVPEESGGAGLGFVEQAIILEELGYALYSGPYLATTVLASPALPPEELAEVASGRRRWTAEIDGLVPELARVDQVVTAEGAADAVGQMLASVDPTRPVGKLAAGERRPLPRGVDRARASIGCAAEAIGVAQRALDLGVEYAKTREQFGRSIGVYQAVAHPLATTYAEVVLARSLVYWAAWSVDETPAQSVLAANAAKSFATETAVASCERSIQAHGGIGFTWEHPLHRFYRRAQWLQAFGGYPATQRAAVAATLLASDLLPTIDRGA